jgi:hypothetical protein
MENVKRAQDWFMILCAVLFHSFPLSLLNRTKKITRHIDYESGFRIYYLFKPAEFDKLKSDYNLYKSTGKPDTGSYQCYTLVAEPSQLELNFKKIQKIATEK